MIEGWTHSRLSAVPGKGKVADHRCCSGRNPGPVVGPHEHLLGLNRVALPPLGHSVRVCVKLLGSRKDLPEILGYCVDLLGADQALDEDPTFFLP